MKGVILPPFKIVGNLYLHFHLQTALELSHHFLKLINPQRAHTHLARAPQAARPGAVSSQVLKLKPILRVLHRYRQLLVYL